MRLGAEKHEAYGWTNQEAAVDETAASTFFRVDFIPEFCRIQVSKKSAYWREKVFVMERFHHRPSMRRPHGCPFRYDPEK